MPKMVSNQYSTVVMTIVLFLLSPYATSLPCNFPSFPDDGEFLYFRDGRLTKNTSADWQNLCVDRPTCTEVTEPFFLHESAAAKMANFSTNLTFVIDDPNGSANSTERSFFLASLKTLLHNSSARDGGSLGRPITLEDINFTSTSLVDPDLSLEVPTPAGLGSKVKPRKHKRHVAVLVGGIVGGFMLVGVLGLGLFNSCKRKVITGESSTEIPGLRRFSYGELALATRNFAEGEKLGDGGDGEFYRGFRYDMNSYVTVKRMSKGSTQRKENKTELEILSRINHRYLMRLIGWCDEQGELLLVFEFTPKGTLDFYLRKADTLLIWGVRYKIAQHLASALLDLHEIHRVFAHRNIQSSNIMLDSNFSAKLGNPLFTFLEQSVTIVVIGTLGYVNPAFLLTGETSKMSDVYSFGVVALEIACGRKHIDRSLKENEIFLVDWVRKLYREGKVIEAADSKLCEDYDRKQMECLMVVGLWCTHSDPSFRPSIGQAIQVLSCDAPLPLLTLSNDTIGSSSQRSTSESSDISSDSANP